MAATAAGGVFHGRHDGAGPMSKVTLRFHAREVEAAYKAKLEKELFKPVLFSCIVVPITIIVFGLSTYSAETKRPELPFVWGTGDPRTMYFATQLAIVSMLLLLGGLSTIRLVSGKLDSFNWEFLTALTWACFVSSLFMISAWHTAMLFGKVPGEAWIESSPDSEFVTLLESIAVVVGASVYFPIRTSILWLVPMCALGSYITMVSLVGSPFPASISHNITYLALLSFVSYQGARRREKDDREKWYSVQMMSNETVELKDVKQAYQQVASAFCEIVVKLGSNKCVEDSDTTHTAFFGRSMEGQPFSEVLDGDEREAFSELLQQASASQELQSMPATLDLNFNSAKVQLIVVDTNVTNARQHSWLVGVHSVEMNHSTVSELNASMMRSLDSDWAQNCGDVDQETRWESLPTTTATGRVFQDMDREDPASFEGGVQQRLESIAKMGSREHWLISPSDMELLPEKILGNGGFGVVVAGRLRGTPVAVKLPKWSVPGRQLPTLASVSNELRLHRHIRHPNIVLWHGSCIDPQSGHLALVYELVSGIQLDEYVHEDLSDLPALQARHKLLVDMACALLYLHSYNPTIVHGDLKTSNILVERWASGPRAKLLDFGLSLLMTKRAAPLGGTLEWMAPELLVNSRHSGRCLAASADVFSFGRLAYFVCAGLNPLAGFQHTLVLQMARQRRPVPLRWTNGTPFLDKCRGLCDVCLSHEPSARPSMAGVRSSLASWLPMPNNGHRGLDEVYCWVASSKGASWGDGLKSLEDTTGAEFSSYTLSVGARDRGEMLLDALEALIEGSHSENGGLEQTNLSNSDILGHGEPTDILGHGEPAASETCSEDPGTIRDNQPAALPEHKASVSL